MTYFELYERMRTARLISAEWRNLLPLLYNELGDDSDCAMKLFTFYFSLVDDGNTYMSLDKKTFIRTLTNKVEKQKIADREDEAENDDFADILAEINESAEHIGELNGLNIIGENKLFVIDNNRLFASKYYNAAKSILKSANRLFTAPSENKTEFDFEDYTKDFTLEEKQKEIVVKGLAKNLIITGGPGTGKTTSILFLLVGLLTKHPELKIYMAAPSAKAKARMGESIRGDMKYINDKVGEKIKTKILQTEGQTIHKLLENDWNNGGFKYNAEHQFDKNSVFIIDEASMIDVCLFASLLEAIPEGARVFILGDKNQLPSVESGAVLADLLNLCEDNVVELTVSRRFKEGSVIYNLAKSVNDGTLEMNESFSPISDFKIVDNEKEADGKTFVNRVFYYLDNEESNKKIVETLTNAWYEKYFKDFRKKCVDLEENKYDSFKKIDEISENAKILCAQNKSTRGAENINKVILEKNYKGKKSSGFYSGEVLMITSNLEALKLYNGDCGVTVRFKDDETLYFMIQKSADLMKVYEKREENKIFKLKETEDAKLAYYFYPIRMISREDITTAFAITIHKSQGSGYNNVFVVLPKVEGHPLLNRQLLYTAITRTKADTYIISNKANLECASNNVLSRNTGII